jgi:membrane protease YdiL (CAAX protease family)
MRLDVSTNRKVFRRQQESQRSALDRRLANILIALALGVILSVFYVWRRDLVANMIAHFLVDSIGDVH